jgi:hypothetical protein
MIFWLDDCFDSQALSQAKLDSILAYAKGKESPSTVEAEAYRELRTSFAELAASPDDLRLWDEYSYFVPFEREAALSAGTLSISFGEYLDNGLRSICLPRTVASASVLWGLDMASRAADPRFMRLLHHQAIVARLENDLYSVKRERAEGGGANAVFLLERHLSPEDARAFVQRELHGYLRLVEDDIQHFDGQAPLLRLCKLLTGMGEAYYNDARERYHPTAG